MSDEKAVKRDLRRLRRPQNPSVADFRRLSRLRDAKTRFWGLRKKRGAVEGEVREPSTPDKKVKEAKEPEPELETIAEEEDLGDEELFDLEDEQS
jgi:hypothetical protein